MEKRFFIKGAPDVRERGGVRTRVFAVRWAKTEVYDKGRLFLNDEDFLQVIRYRKAKPRADRRHLSTARLSPNYLLNSI
jgi:hypothetical protein